MEKRPPLPMTQLDMLVTTQELQMMKLMLPYIPSSYRGMLAVYLKFMEFQNTFRLFNGSSPSDVIKSRDIHSPADILEDLRPFMNPGDMESFDMMMNTMNMMNGMNMSDLSGSGNSEEVSELMNIFDNILKGKKDNE